MEVLGELLTTELVRSGVRLGTPIMLAALGAAISHRAGIINLALEGKMLLGAFVGILAAFYLGNSYLGVVAAGLAGGALGAVFAFVYLRYQVNLIILGIGINIFIAEITVFLMRVYLGDVGSWSDPSIEQLPDIVLPGIQLIPIIGNIVSRNNMIIYTAWIAVIGMQFLLFYTRFGRHVRAVGENQEAAETVGISVPRVKVFALVIAGILCGIGGAFLSIGHLTLFTRAMTNGRGWIGLTAALFAQDHPIAIFFVASFFGLAESLAIRLQTTTNIPPSLVQFLPHLLTLLALILVGLRTVTRDRLARRAFRQRAEREVQAQEAVEASQA